MTYEELNKLIERSDTYIEVSLDGSKTTFDINDKVKERICSLWQSYLYNRGRYVERLAEDCNMKGMPRRTWGPIASPFECHLNDMGLAEIQFMNKREMLKVEDNKRDQIIQEALRIESELKQAHEAVSHGQYLAKYIIPRLEDELVRVRKSLKEE